MAERRLIFGKTNTLLERIHSLDGKWYVEFRIIKYFCFGIEVYTTKKELVKYNNDKNEVGNGHHL